MRKIHTEMRIPDPYEVTTYAVVGVIVVVMGIALAVQPVETLVSLLTIAKLLAAVVGIIGVGYAGVHGPRRAWRWYNE